MFVGISRRALLDATQIAKTTYLPEEISTWLEEREMAPKLRAKRERLASQVKAPRKRKREPGSAATKYLPSPPVHATELLITCVQARTDWQTTGALRRGW